MEVLLWQALIAVTIYGASQIGRPALLIATVGWVIWTFAIANTGGLLALQLAVIGSCAFFAAGRQASHAKAKLATQNAPPSPAASAPAPKKADSSWGFAIGMVAVAAFQFWPKLFPSEPPSAPPPPQAISRPPVPYQAPPAISTAPAAALPTIKPVGKQARLANGPVDMRDCLALHSDAAMARCAERAK